MYKIGFASDLVIAGDLPDDDFWVCPKKSTDRLAGLSNFSSAIGPFDCFVVNVEAPILENGKAQKSLKNGPCLKQHPSVIDTLKRLDVGVALLANNHIDDFGRTGIESTIEALESAGIASLGAGADIAEAAEPHIIKLPSDCRRAELAIVNYAEEEFGAIGILKSSGYNPVCYRQALIDVKRFNLDSPDVYSVAVVHGGAEFCSVPPPWLRTYAQFLVEAGFDLVLCQHTHVIGCLENYKQGTIVYGQGNFIFPYSGSKAAPEKWDEGLIVSLCLDQSGEALKFLKTEFNSSDIVRLDKELDLNDPEFHKFFNLLSDEDVYLDDWIKWCELNSRRYSNVFLGNSILRRFINKLFSCKYKFSAQKRLKLINYIRSASHSDVFKTLASLSLDFDKSGGRE